MEPKHIIELFDRFLAARSCPFEAVCIGGTALALLGVVTRETQDCDVLSPLIPEQIKKLSAEFAREVSGSGLPLKMDWLNNGPQSLLRDLPAGWADRLQLAFKGSALTLRTLGRNELLQSKLFALCDRAVDRADCIALNPTRAELTSILPWLEQRDANPQWPQHVRETLTELATALGYELQ